MLINLISVIWLLSYHLSITCVLVCPRALTGIRPTHIDIIACLWLLHKIKDLASYRFSLWALINKLP